MKHRNIRKPKVTPDSNTWQQHLAATPGSNHLAATTWQQPPGSNHLAATPGCPFLQPYQMTMSNQKFFGTMFISQFKSLLKSIGQLPLETACPLQLAYICFGYRHLLSLSYTSPRITSVLGEEARAEAVITRMHHIIDMLAASLDQEMSAGDRARAIVYLLQTLTFQYCPWHMEVALNAMDEFLQPQESSAAEGSAHMPLSSSATDPSADLCKILCHHYYFRSDENSRRQAETILDSWISDLKTENQQSSGAGKEGNRIFPQSADGSWTLPLDQALERIDALVMYSDMVDEQRYEKKLHRILEHYAQDLQISKKVRFLSIMSQAGGLYLYRKQMEQIIDHILQGDFSLEADITSQCKEQDLLLTIRFYALALRLEHFDDACTAQPESGN